MRRQRRKARSQDCVCCGQSVSFCWNCKCGFSICQACMEDNRWGLTCNNITWECPDCGGFNGYGNQ